MTVVMKGPRIATGMDAFDPLPTVNRSSAVAQVSVIGGGSLIVECKGVSPSVHYPLHLVVPFDALLASTWALDQRAVRLRCSGDRLMAQPVKEQPSRL